jgi:succinate dehydrogenase hydrophobic anchor subunit
MWTGLILLCLAVLLAVSGSRGVYRDYAEGRWGWATLGVVVTFFGVIALVTFTFIAGAVAGGP